MILVLKNHLDKGENFSWMSWGKELKKITNQDKLLNTMLETYYGEKKGSGKDTVSEYLINHYGYNRYAFGDPVKDVCRVMFNFSEDQL